IEKMITTLTENLAFIVAPTNKPIVLKSIMKNLKMSDPSLIKEGYQDQLLTLARKPYPSLDGLRNAQKLITLQNPKLAKLRVEDIVEPRFVRKLDESGFIDRLYNSQH